MLLKEIELLKLMDHPNIIKVVEIFQDCNKLSLVMELCTGGELTEFIRKQPGSKLTERRARPIASKMLRALAYLHANHMIHRDIKPENFIFTSDEPTAELKMIDFGVSRQTADHMTRITGTPEYMAPEVVIHDYSDKSDIWSLGVTLFNMVCGVNEMPFDAADPGCTDRYIVPRTLGQQSGTDDAEAYRIDLDTKFENFGLSPNLRNLLHKLLTVDPGQRPTAREALRHPWIHKVNLNGGVARPNATMLDISSQGKFAEFGKLSILQRTALLAGASALLEMPDIVSLNSQFEALDEDNDGVLSFDEFRAGFVDVHGKLPMGITDVRDHHPFSCPSCSIRLIDAFPLELHCTCEMCLICGTWLTADCPPLENCAR
jgi:calcium-dependent protein kinase